MKINYDYSPAQSWRIETLLKLKPILYVCLCVNGCIHVGPVIYDLLSAYYGQLDIRLVSVCVCV